VVVNGTLCVCREFPVISVPALGKEKLSLLVLAVLGAGVLLIRKR
jgi:hypothetical protein